ncbi:hypothetical protein HYR99_08770 [Candidatus Poribacteria bacterium]|nr:hypothetical protein [Candidatus Poribacteria bacterium]
MDFHTAHINLILAWLWIVLGFVSGFLLGLGFHQQAWLGGYTSFKRRLYRLGHISFFGLALMNLMFYFTVQGLTHPSRWVDIASVGFIVGAISMPICCVTMAHCPKLRTLFAIPVSSLIVAGFLTLWEVSGL